MMAEQRDKKQDIFKGFGMLAVMMIHLMAEPTGAYVFKMGAASSVVLIFFLVAGMNYRPEAHTPAGNIRNRAIFLLKYFFGYTLLITLVCGAWLAASGRMTVSGIILSVMRYIVFGFHLQTRTVITDILVPSWFLIEMLFASILFYLIAPTALKSRKRTWTCIALLILITAVPAGFGADVPVWHLQDIPCLTAVMLMGTECARLGVTRKMPQGTVPNIALFCVSVCLGALFFRLFGGVQFLANGTWLSGGICPCTAFLSVPLAMILMAIDFFAFCSASALAEKLPLLCRLLVRFGQHSKTVVLVHLPFAFMVSWVLGWTVRDTAAASEPAAYLRNLVIFLLTLVLSCLWNTGEDKLAQLRKAKKHPEKRGILNRDE